MAKAYEECRKLKRQIKDLEAEFQFLREDFRNMEERFQGRSGVYADVEDLGYEIDDLRRVRRI
jgi:hypothetical protein